MGGRGGSGGMGERGGSGGMGERGGSGGMGGMAGQAAAPAVAPPSDGGGRDASAVAAGAALSPAACRHCGRLRPPPGGSGFLKPSLYDIDRNNLF